MGRLVLLIFVLIPIVFNAITLLPELSLPVPNLNDDAAHYLFIQRASEALASGENPFDHYVPENDLGFPQFFYYQHLPHLAVVFLHRLLLKQVDLLTLFNLVRYLLLIGFPLTVYWSMRRLDFSAAAGAVAAAGATLLSSHTGYGLEYGSYIWRGFGMYTQLWAMHLFLVTLACLDRLLQKGEGYIAAIISCSMLFLSHLLYAYMMVVVALILLFLDMNRTNAWPRLARLSITAVYAAAISSYLWLPWLLLKEYMNMSPYLERWKYDSFGAGDILTWLVNGDLLDHGRLPVLTILLALGIASALISRTRRARMSLFLLFIMLIFFLGRATWSRMVDFLPMGKDLHFLRFLGGVHTGAILLFGLGGGWVWQQLALLRKYWRALIFGLVLLVLLFPALQEREKYYSQNTQWMERTEKAVEADEDARNILSVLKDMPPGRTYAGLRANLGKDLKFGDIYFYDLLTFHRVVAVSPSYQGMSFNSDLIWHFDDQNPAHYNLFNVRYVVAPSGLAMPDFLRRIKRTTRYTLYRAETSGYAQFVALKETKKIHSQLDLFSENRSWMLSGEPAEGRFVRYEYPKVNKKVEAKVKAVTPVEKTGGKINEEKIYPGKIDLKVETPEAAVLVLKVTYHPNWCVTIDGREIQPFMVSSNFIGMEVPAGSHQIRAEYRSPLYKNILLILGACTLLATILFRRWFTRLDELLTGNRRGSFTIRGPNDARRS